MAATFTEITAEDMEKFLKRGFRALRPKKALKNGEVVYDLNLSENVAIRIYTTIRPNSGLGAGKGSDSIKILLWGPKTQRPLTAGKAAPIVKRTEGWRNSLQNRIEDMMELYEEKEPYWEGKGGAPQQVDDRDTDLDDGEGQAPPPPPVDNGGPLYGTFTKTRAGGWAAKIKGTGRPGARAILETQNRKKVPVTLSKKIWSGQDQYGSGYVEVWEIENTRQASEPNYDYDRTSYGVD